MSENEPRTWHTPPPGVTRVTDVTGRTWTRDEDDRWTTHTLTPTRYWGELLDVFGPLTEAPTPTLPTQPGSIIRASGQSAARPFRDEVLVLDSLECWRGDVFGGFVTNGTGKHPQDHIDTFTVLATYDPALYEAAPKGTAHAWHDPATQAVVPRKEWEALRETHAGKPWTSMTHWGPAALGAARTLLIATEEAER